jgi:hypothetical protein
MILDVHELDDFSKKCLEIAQSRYPKETKNFMNRSGRKLKKDIETAEKGKLKYSSGRKTGNLLKGLTSTRPKEINNSFQVRVKFRQPAYHAWLVEHGHALWFHHARRGHFASARFGGRFVPGNHAVGDTVNGFQPTMNGLLSDFTNRFVNEVFR